MLEKFIAFLERNKILNIFLVLIFTFAVIGLHDFMVQQSVRVMNAMGLEFYNKFVAYFSLLGLISLVSFLSFQLYKNRNQFTEKLFFLFATLLFMSLHFHWMFEMNIEIIHSLQYGVLGLLLFPFTRKIGFSIILALPIMLLDEWYQYQVLYPDYVEYFEFNDILMNIFGLALFSIILWISSVKVAKISISDFRKHKGIHLLLLYVLILSSLLFSGLVVFYPESKLDFSLLVLNQMETREFWTIHKFTGAKYHILSPMEAIISLFGFSVFYLSSDFKLGSKK